MIAIIVIGFLIGLLLNSIALGINNDKMALAGLIVSIMFSIGIGVWLAYNTGIDSKNIVTPKIHVVCENGKCDTTYIYKFKN